MRINIINITILLIFIIIYQSLITFATTPTWSNLVFEGDGNDNMYNGIVLDNGAMIWGITTQSFGVSYSNWYNGAYLWMKINAAGDVVSSTLVELADPLVVYDLAYIPGKNYTVAVGADSNWRSIIIVVDSNGTVVGAYSLSPAPTGILYYYLTQVDYGPDGSLVLTGTYVTTSYQSYIWVTKADDNLTILSSYSYPLRNNVAWTQTMNNSLLVIAGYRYYDLPWIAVLNYTDLSVKQAVTIGYSSSDIINDIILYEDGIYFVGRVYNSSLGKSVGVLGKLDLSLTGQWALLINYPEASKISLHGASIINDNVFVVGYYKNGVNTSLVLLANNTGFLKWSYSYKLIDRDTWFYTVSPLSSGYVIVMGGAGGQSTGMDTLSVLLDSYGREPYGCRIGALISVNSTLVSLPITPLSLSGTDIMSSVQLQNLTYTESHPNVSLRTICPIVGGCVLNNDNLHNPTRIIGQYEVLIGISASSIVILILLYRKTRLA